MTEFFAWDGNRLMLVYVFLYTLTNEEMLKESESVLYKIRRGGTIFNEKTLS